MMAFLQNAVFYVLPFLLVITVIVTIHELGHFVTARAFGVAIDRFSIGFGPPIVSWSDRGGVEWRIGWLPLGGYVRFAGDENAASVPDKADLADHARRHGCRARASARSGNTSISSRCGSARSSSSPGRRRTSCWPSSCSPSASRCSASRSRRRASRWSQPGRRPGRLPGRRRAVGRRRTADAKLRGRPVLCAVSAGVPIDFTVQERATLTSRRAARRPPGPQPVRRRRDDRSPGIGRPARQAATLRTDRSGRHGRGQDPGRDADDPLLPGPHRFGSGRRRPASQLRRHSPRLGRHHQAGRDHGARRAGQLGDRQAFFLFQLAA